MLDIAQMPPALQRSFGRGEICFDANGLQRLFQQGCAKILLPKTYGSIAEAVIVNTAGGLTGGDVFEIVSAVDGLASLCTTSQTAERIYRAKANVARVVNHVKIGAGSYMEWLPQETILFEGSGLSRLLEVDLTVGSRFLAMESVVLGRKASGEILTRCQMNDQWRVRRDGKLIYADGLRFGPEVNSDFGRASVFAGASALANLVYIASDAQGRLNEARALMAKLSVEYAVSSWDDILVVRILANDGQDLRQALVEFLQNFRGQTMPRVWQM